jgi:hypothetical protein
MQLVIPMPRAAFITVWTALAYGPSDAAQLLSRHYQAAKSLSRTTGKHELIGT